MYSHTDFFEQLFWSLQFFKKTVLYILWPFYHKHNHSISFLYYLVTLWVLTSFLWLLLSRQVNVSSLHFRNAGWLQQHRYDKTPVHLVAEGQFLLHMTSLLRHMLHCMEDGPEGHFIHCAACVVVTDVKAWRKKPGTIGKNKSWKKMSMKISPLWNKWNALKRFTHSKCQEVCYKSFQN